MSTPTPPPTRLRESRPAVAGALLLLLACGGPGADSGPMALVGVTVIDGRGNPPRPGRVVTLRDGRIAEVAAAAGWTAPGGTRVIDLAGRYVMPGLVDAHARVVPAAGSISPEEAETVLRTLLGFGVVAVRDTAESGKAGDDLVRRLAEGEIAGPRLVTDGATPDRRGLVVFDGDAELLDRVAWLEEVDLNGPEIGDAIAALAAERIPVAPTLLAFHARFWGDDPSHRQNPELHLAPAGLRAAWEGAADRWTADDAARARAVWPRLLELVRRLHQGGALLVAGSGFPDPWVIPGVGLHHELRLLHEAGIPPLEVLEIATRNGALALGLEAEIGIIEAGKSADLVVLAADPTASLHNTRTISHLFVRGRFLDPAALLASGG